jgi:hypothetical protein
MSFSDIIMKGILDFFICVLTLGAAIRYLRKDSGIPQSLHHFICIYEDSILSWCNLLSVYSSDNLLSTVRSIKRIAKTLAVRAEDKLDVTEDTLNL